MTARSTPRVSAGILCATLLFAGSIASAFAGYSVEIEILNDGKRALPGFLHGYLAFTLSAIAVAFIFRKTYAALVGSWIWAALGLSLLALGWFLFVVSANIGIDTTLYRW